MLKQRYKGAMTVLLMTALAACSTEQFSDELTPGTTPVQLSGALTRATGDGLLITTGNPLVDYKNANVNFYLSARTAADNSVYFSNMPMTIGDNKSDGRNNLNSNVYYPLGKTAINLYVHTGTIAIGTPANTINLTSGTALSNDILFGKGTDATGNTVVSGKSDSPVEYMTFQHLMTKVTVNIDVIDATDDPVTGGVQPTLPTNIQMTLKNSAVVTGGTYNMVTGAGTANANDYTLKVGTHYLVPTGKVLSGTGLMKSLVIDDYTATVGDLAAFTIPQADKNGTLSDFKLDPGLSYTLTFQIKRLKLVGIKLTLNDWTTKSGTGTWGYEAYPVSLNIEGESGGQGYDETKITKMVLKHTIGGQTYQYIGKGNNGTINFVTLPSDLIAGTASASSLKADLYSQNELLIKDIDVTNSSASGLKIVLGENGLKQNVDVPTEPYYEITTPLQFALFMNSITSSTTGTYRIVNDIDMDNTSVDIVPPTEFPSLAVLDGSTWDAGSYKVHKILHLNLSGNGLVSENKGTLKNIYLASGAITSTSGDYSGSICAVNNGTIAGCVNQTNIVATATQTIGGICGSNGSTGKVLACLNAGNIANAITVGGICGQNQNASAASITASLNVGLLNKSATNLGGICGKDEVSTNSKIIDTCYWLTGVARKNQAISNEIAIGNKNATTIVGLTDNASDLAAQTIRSAAIYTDKLTSRLSADGAKWIFTLNSSVSSWPIPVPIP